MADFSLTGVESCQQRLTAIDRNTRKALGSAAQDEAEHIVQRARELVPVDTGGLRDTIHVVSGELSQGRNLLGQFTSAADIIVIVTAGDDSTPHALAVHEHPSQYDPPSWRGNNVTFNPSGTGAKFLERPFLDSLPGMADRTASKVGPKLG